MLKEILKKYLNNNCMINILKLRKISIKTCSDLHYCMNIHKWKKLISRIFRF